MLACVMVRLLHGLVGTACSDRRERGLVQVNTGSTRRRENRLMCISPLQGFGS